MLQYYIVRNNNLITPVYFVKNKFINEPEEKFAFPDENEMKKLNKNVIITGNRYKLLHRCVVLLRVVIFSRLKIVFLKNLESFAIFAI